MKIFNGYSKTLNIQSLYNNSWLQVDFIQTHTNTDSNTTLPFVQNTSRFLGKAAYYDNKKTPKLLSDAGVQRTL